MVVDALTDDNGIVNDNAQHQQEREGRQEVDRDIDNGKKNEGTDK